MDFKRNGVRKTAFKFSERDTKILQDNWRNHTTKKSKYPSKFSGKGIVFTAGGIKYITCAWVSISLLRKIGCDLPIELWHLNGELSKEIIQKFRHLNVVFRDFHEIGNTKLFGYMLKPLAIINSSFKEVLFLDADNNCVRNPEYLFHLTEYKDNGCIFWPDYFYTSKDNSIWSIIGIKPNKQLEQESGQILIDKEKCWHELQLCLHFNILGRYYYNILLGDKDTFKFAWLALGSKFHMVHYSPGTCGYKVNNVFYGNTMVQHDTAGDILFLHRNLLKWDVTFDNEINWQYIRKYEQDSTHRKIIIRKGERGWLGIDLGGTIEETVFDNLFAGLEITCLEFLRELRSSQEYSSFSTHCYIEQNRP
jgi:alpha 1,2-mannosyltransferase